MTQHVPPTCHRCSAPLYGDTPHGPIGAAWWPGDGYAYCNPACATRSAAQARAAAAATQQAEAPEPPKRPERQTRRTIREHA